MTTTELWNTNADPRATQKRIATTLSGRQVWIDITGDDRLRAIMQLPSRWPDVIKARERGESLQSIARWAKCPPPCQPECRLTPALRSPSGLVLPDTGGEHMGPDCLAWLVSACYTNIETALADLAVRRGRLMP